MATSSSSSTTLSSSSSINTKILQQIKYFVEKTTFLFIIILFINLIPFCYCNSSLGIEMIKQPESIVAPLGDEVIFVCELNLDPDRLEWRFRPLNIRDEQHNEFISINSKTSGYNITTLKNGISKLRIYVNQKSLGEYQCIAWFGTSALASVPAKLILAGIGLEVERDQHGISINQQIVRWEVNTGSSLLIKCRGVTSNPEPVWTVYKDNKQVSSNAPQLQSGALIISQASPQDSGTYWCSAVNSLTGNEVKAPQKTVLTITQDKRQKISPKFTEAPPSVITVKPGTTAILECPGIGNPIPKAIWSRPDGTISDSRSSILSYGLQIRNVTKDDAGFYFCRLDNGVAPPLNHRVLLQILETPVITESFRATLTNETDSLILECRAKGSPTPEIYWMINGENTRLDPVIQPNGSRILIRSVEKRHAGIVQCFARNEVGEVSVGNLLRVNPKQIPGEIGTPLGSLPQSTKSSFDHTRKPPRGHKNKHKNPVLVPPSRPNVTRLSDESVMARWSVPSNDGLSIQFFKVQYRMLGDAEKKVAKSEWKTCNEEISPHVRSYEVTSLKPDHYYRFRIAAAYSNNDNKLGSISTKFLLQRGAELGPAKSHIVAPKLQKVEPVSETAIALHWEFPDNPPNMVDGFYAYFRAASTASEYSKATIDGMFVRNFLIDHLEPGTAYEFKLQSFTSSAASDFSAILTGMTHKPPTPPPTIVPSVVSASEGSQKNAFFNPMILGGIVGIIILVGFSVCLFCYCMRRKKNAQREDESVNENKSHPDHVDGNNGFSTNNPSHRHNSPSHKSNRTNGMPRINITSNPMATTDGSGGGNGGGGSGGGGGGSDKNRNVMELRFLPTTPIVQQNNNCPTPDPHRRSLERNMRQIQQGGGGGVGGSSSSFVGDPKMMMSDGDLGLGGSRSGRGRIRRSSGSGTGSPRIIRGVSSELLQHNRSPMPARAAMKRGNRLGNRTENMSSGSLNSIEV